MYKDMYLLGPLLVKRKMFHFNTHILYSAVTSMFRLISVCLQNVTSQAWEFSKACWDRLSQAPRRPRVLPLQILDLIPGWNFSISSS